MSHREQNIRKPFHIIVNNIRIHCHTVDSLAEQLIGWTLIGLNFLNLLLFLKCFNLTIKTLFSSIKLCLCCLNQFFITLLLLWCCCNWFYLLYYTVIGSIFVESILVLVFHCSCVDVASIDSSSCIVLICCRRFYNRFLINYYTAVVSMLLESIVVSVLHCTCVHGAGSSLKRKLRKRTDLHRLKISGCYGFMMFSSLSPVNRKPKPIQSEEEDLSKKRMIYNTKYFLHNNFDWFCVRKLCFWPRSITTGPISFKLVVLNITVYKALC